MGMSTADFLHHQLHIYESALLKGSWPLPDSSGADYFLDVGLDPSMASSGACAILRQGSKILFAKTLHHKTEPGTPTPLRLNSVSFAVTSLMREVAEQVTSGHLHVTLLFEIPPTQMSSSAWLFALNQFIWVGFSVENPFFTDLLERGVKVSFNQWAIGVTQFKHVYHLISERYKLGHSYKAIKSTKSVVVAIVQRMLEDSPELKRHTPKRFNNDVAEGIALACLAGGCSCIKDFKPIAQTPYSSVCVTDLLDLIISKQVNKKNERMGWIYRPMVHSFGWEIIPMKLMPVYDSIQFEVPLG